MVLGRTLAAYKSRAQGEMASAESDITRIFVRCNMKIIATHQAAFTER
jgi:hypothetical protein